MEDAARRLADATALVFDLNTELERMGLSDLDRELASIADRAIDYRLRLEELGHATDDNIATVSRWETALKDAAIAADDATQAADKLARHLQSLNTLGDAWMGRVQSALRTVERAIESQRDQQLADIDARRAATQASIDALTPGMEKLRDLSGSLRSALEQLRPVASPTLARDAARAQITAALAIARAGGVLPDADSLRNALSTLTQDASDQFATRTDYLRDAARTAAEVGALADLTDAALTVDERQLSTLQDQLKSLDDLKKAINEGFAAQLQAARAQVDAVMGVDTTLLSVADAMQALTDATRSLEGVQRQILAASLNQLASGQTIDTSKLATAPKNTVINTGTSQGYVSSAGAVAAAPVNATSLSDWTIQGLSGNTWTAQTLHDAAYAYVGAGGSPLDIYNAAKQEGIDLSALNAVLQLPPGTAEEWARANGLPTFARGGLALPGWAMVGEQGPELVNFSRPGRVYTAADTRTLLSGDDGALLEELRALREELAHLRAETRATARHTSKTASLLERAMPDGDALAVRETAL